MKLITDEQLVKVLNEAQVDMSRFVCAMAGEEANKDAITQFFGVYKNYILNYLQITEETKK